MIFKHAHLQALSISCVSSINRVDEILLKVYSFVHVGYFIQ